MQADEQRKAEVEVAVPDVEHWRDDAEWLEVQYNNRARVPEHPQILARWAGASDLSRDRSDAVLDLAYGDTPGQRLDVFRPVRPRAGGAPVLVFIHGGWWRALDKRDHAFVAPSFTDAGALVVLPNYDLCPAVTIETIALQLTRALAWTWRHAAEHGGDPRRLVVVGHSAGGHLAAMLLACDWSKVDPALPADLVTQACGISGVYDLAPIARTPSLQADLRLTPEAVSRLSVAGFPPPAGRRMFAAVGALESQEFLRQNALLRARWGREVVPVCETVPDTNHFDVLHALVDPAARLHGLLREALGLGG